MLSHYQMEVDSPLPTSFHATARSNARERFNLLTASPDRRRRTPSLSPEPRRRTPPIEPLLYSDASFGEWDDVDDVVGPDVPVSKIPIYLTLLTVCRACSSILTGPITTMISIKLLDSMLLGSAPLDRYHPSSLIYAIHLDLAISSASPARRSIGLPKQKVNKATQ